MSIDFEGLYQDGGRIGKLFYLPGALVDCEGVPDALEEFFTDWATEEGVIIAFTPSWPDYRLFVEGIVKDWREEREDDRCGADRAYLYEMAYLFARRSPKPFLAQVDFQIKSYHRADPKGVGLGSFSSGWGYYGMRWILGDSIDDVMRHACAIAREETEKAWRNALPKEKA